MAFSESEWAWIHKEAKKVDACVFEGEVNIAHMTVTARDKRTNEALKVEYAVELNKEDAGKWELLDYVLTNMPDDVVQAHGKIWRALANGDIPGWQFVVLHEIGHSTILNPIEIRVDYQLRLHAHGKSYRELPLERDADGFAFDRLEQIYGEWLGAY